jgi:hypothetical protein
MSLVTITKEAIVVWQYKVVSRDLYHFNYKVEGRSHDTMMGK